MRTVDIHAAKANLWKLIERAVARANPSSSRRPDGPMAKVPPTDRAEAPRPRIGFMKGRITVPDNFDDLGREDIQDLFEAQR